MKCYNLFLLFVALLFVVGCSNKVPLSGTVTFSDDGAPLTRGVVFFQSDTLLAQGAIQPNGRYTVGTDRMTDGLPRGTYRIYLVDTEIVEIIQTATGQIDPITGNNVDYRFTDERRTPVIDLRYNRADTSGLTFTVDGRTRTFDIQVERIGGR